jgi:hypothetical protein
LAEDQGSALAPVVKAVKDRAREALSAKWVIKRIRRSLLEGLVLRQPELLGKYPSQAIDL